MSEHDLPLAISMTDPLKKAVLIVEDEPLILMDALDIAEEAGFLAIGARNADEALLVLQQRSDVDVLFTDVDMPGSLNGLALARSARTALPSIGVVIASGRLRPGPGDLPEGGAFLSKPYRPSSVVDAIRAQRACTSH